MNYAVILSGGTGTRMRQDGFPKQYLVVGGKSILSYTLKRFQESKDVDKIVIVADEKWHTKIREWINYYDISKFQCFALPGDTRQGSILNGLMACNNNPSEYDKVIIHDAVRPMVSCELISKCYDMIGEYEGCMPVVPITDTVYYSEDARSISRLLDRSRLFGGQAPEAFELKKYLEINKSVMKSEIDSTRGSTEIAYNHNMNIVMIPGEVGNFKLTTPEDLERFEIMINKEENDESL